VRIVWGRWVAVGDDLKLLVYKRNRRKHLIDPGMRPYFFIETKHFPDVKGEILKRGFIAEKNVAVTIYGDDATKIEVDFPYQVKQFRFWLHRRGITTFEGDILFVQRWMIDKDVTYEPGARKWYIDIEVDPRDGFPSPDRPKQRILSIAVVDDRGNERFYCDDDEARMLEDFLSDLERECDILVGWNIEVFDVPYIEGRAKKHKVECDALRCVHVLDLMVIDSRFVNRTSNALDDVAQEVLGEGKVFTFEGERVRKLWDLFEHHRDILRDYNMTDAWLVKRLDDELRYTELCERVAEVSRVFPPKAIYPRAVTDALILYHAGRENPRIVFPTKSGDQGENDGRGRFRGALILEPKAGIYTGIACLDFYSLYNRIMRACNIGLDTLDPNGEIEINGLRFTKRKESIFAKCLRILEDLRNEYKKKRDEHPTDSAEYRAYDTLQRAVKQILLSFYGATGDSGSRYYDGRVAESVTYVARDLLMFIKNVVEEDFGFEVIYGDTDSIFIHIPFTIRDIGGVLNRLCEHINRRVDEYVTKKYNAFPGLIYLKPEYYFDRFFITPKKKRYHARYIWKDGKHETNFLTRGFEEVRKDVPEIVKTVLRKIFELVMNDVDYEQFRVELARFLRGIKSDLYAGKYFEELVFHKSLSKDPSEYKSKQPHVKAARKLMKMGRFRGWEKVHYVVVGRGKDGLEVEPVVEGRKVRITRSGYDYYWRLVLHLIERLFGREFVDALETVTLRRWMR